MRTAAVLVTVLASVAIAVFAVERFDDRRTLVPPPESVSEEFVRQILASRAEQAMPLVSDGLRHELSPEELDDYGRELEEQLGDVGKVLAESEWISARRANVRVALEGARATKMLWFELVRDGAEWTIERLGESAAAPRARRPGPSI